MKINKIAEQFIEQARKNGAEIAEVAVSQGDSLSVMVRLGKMEQYEQSEERIAGLRVIIGKKQAIVTTSDFADGVIAELAEKAVIMAKESPEDPYIETAREAEFAKSIPDLKLEDQKPAAEKIKSLAFEAEENALAIKGVTNSNGVESGYGFSRYLFANSNGFVGEYGSGVFSLSASMIAGRGEDMQRDYEYHSIRFIDQLDSPKQIGEGAANRAIAKLNPRKIETQTLPVIFDKRMAKSLLASFVSAINGQNIARGGSFLKDSLGLEIFASNINVIDDPLIEGALASRPFDGEGFAAKRNDIVKNGVLSSFLLDLSSAKKLGLKTTHSAARSVSSPPYPTSSNLYLQNGEISYKELLSSFPRAFLVTEMFGMGVRLVNGDFSQGASGFIVENGEIAYPVSEVTIASNLKDMFKSLIAANDLEFRYGINSPTIAVGNMMVAGK